MAPHSTYVDRPPPSAGTSGDERSPSPSEDGAASPARLLSLAIKKRRAMFGRKDRDFRKELLLGATISRLCRHIGEMRVARSTAGSGGGELVAPSIDATHKWSGAGCKRKRRHSIAPPASLSLSAARPSADGDRRVPDGSLSAESAGDSSDPFGLDTFFAGLKRPRLER